MAQAPLLTVDELPRFGIPWEFLQQFVPRPIVVQISTGGALGTMQFQWQFLGEVSFNAPIVSSPRAPFAFLLGDNQACCTLTFAAGTHTLGVSYVIDELGHITGGEGLVAASRFDKRVDAISSVTGKAISRMGAKIVKPLLSWGDDVRRHAAAWVKYELKSDKGMTPVGAGAGDENVRLQMQDAMEFFKNICVGDERPADLVDSSAQGKGGGLLVYPTSQPSQGWRG